MGCEQSKGKAEQPREIKDGRRIEVPTADAVLPQSVATPPMAMPGGRGGVKAPGDPLMSVSYTDRRLEEERFFENIIKKTENNLINTSEYHNVAQIRDSGDHPANHHLSMLPEHKPQKLMQLPLLSSSAAVVFGVPVDKSEHTLISQAASTIAAVLSVVAVTGDAEVVMQLPVLKRTET